MNGIRVVFSMLTFGAALAVTWPQSAEARVTKITITQIESPTYTGESFGNVGQYERLVGTAAGEIDPQDRHNEIISDIRFAPRNARGNVEYVSTFTLVKPIDLSRGNATLLYEVVNRGNKQLSAFNVGGTSGGISFDSRRPAARWTGQHGAGLRLRPGSDLQRFVGHHFNPAVHHQAEDSDARPEGGWRWQRSGRGQIGARSGAARDLSRLERGHDRGLRGPDLLLHRRCEGVCTQQG
jgi:hypothetical protein